MHDRALHTAEPCPGGCGDLHPPWASFCHRCKAYISDLTTDSPKPANEPAKQATADHPDPVCVTWPWAILANVNDRVSPVDEKSRRQYARYKRRRDSMAAVVAQIANGRKPFTGPVRVTFDFYTPDEREDPQNKEKAALDALEGPPDLPGIYVNDRQARHRVSIDHGVDTERPRMEVRVEAIVGGEV